ncbi:MAG: NAD-dependent epimerase/dehydratase family protein [candidate division Zixibacteria bacterium]|nr:NAD-dependent epimerase/dehydratase family protein [candidate division Zixibacteria bacterium]
MPRRQYSYLQAAVDFVAYIIVIWLIIAIRPTMKGIYGSGVVAYLFPFLVSAFMVGILALFRQYRLKQRDRFLRQFMGAFNAITLGFLLIVVISVDLGFMAGFERGHLFMLFIGLLIAAVLSRIVIYMWFGRKPDFSLKDQIILKQSNGHKKQDTSSPLILPDTLGVDEIKNRIDASSYDFAVMTDESGYFSGTITDGDIIEASIKKGKKPIGISDIVDRSHPVAREILSAGKMRHMMLERNLRFLPLLTNEGKPARVVLLSDLDSKYSIKPKDRKNNRVLIIGGAGYIGSIMTRYLLKRGYYVSVLDNLMCGYDALKALDNHPAYSFYKGDARNIQDLLTAMDDVDSVIHLAAIVGDPACALDPRATIDINYESSKILVDACLHKKVNRLLFASSCSVYGASENDELLTENSPLNPVSLYAETRLRSEEAILNQAEAPLAVTMFRLATVFGFSYRPRFDLVVNILTARALIDGEISIFGGSQWRPNIHARDVVSGFVAGMEAPKEVADRQIFNLGSEAMNYRIAELGDLVREALPDIKVKTVEAEMDRRDYKVCFDRIEKTLNWKANVTVRDGIQEIIDAYHNKKFGHYNEKRYSNLKILQEV